MKLHKDNSAPELWMVHRTIFGGPDLKHPDNIIGWSFYEGVNMKRRIRDDWKYTYRFLVPWSGVDNEMP